MGAELGEGSVFPLLLLFRFLAASLAETALEHEAQRVAQRQALGISHFGEALQQVVRQTDADESR